jgi:tripartite-type tricarboxylate transporter receptor subunit TctC
MRQRHRLSVLGLLSSMAFFISFAAHDRAWPAEYPAKPIEMVVPFGAGGAADIAARILASGAEKTLGRPIAVINRTGGGGAIGYSAVKNARPDGYTLMWNSTALLTLAHAGNIDFDYRAFEPVCLISTETPTLAVKKDAPWKDLRELIEYAKKNPGKVRVGNSGFGSATHIAAEALEEMAAAPMTHVPFGQGLAVSSLLGGKIEASVQLPAEMAGPLDAGQVRLLAVSSEKRLAAFPSVPTMTEQQVALIFEVWRGVGAPKGTPKEVLAKLEAAFAQAVKDKAFIDAAQKFGFTVNYQPGAAFTKFLHGQDELVGRLMKRINVKK